MRVVYVGNDIVDLEQPRTAGRPTDERFVGRVYDADEQAAIRDAPDPDLELWSRWSAKEAGFKVISKLIGTPPPFVHRAFKVVWSETVDPIEYRDGRVVRRGHVTYEAHRAEVHVALHAGNVHAVAVGEPGGSASEVELHPRVDRLDAPGRPWSGPLEELQGRFTDQERSAVYSRPSAAVRLGARADLARLMGVDESRLEIICDPGPTSRRPPRVILDGTRAAADVSLSHDGRWIAWVLCLDRHGETT